MTSKLLHPIEIIPKEGCFWTFTLIFPQTFVSKHGQDALLDTFDVIMREKGSVLCVVWTANESFATITNWIYLRNIKCVYCTVGRCHRLLFYDFNDVVTRYGTPLVPRLIWNHFKQELMLKFKGKLYVTHWLILKTQYWLSWSAMAQQWLSWGSAMAQ